MEGAYDIHAQPPGGRGRGRGRGGGIPLLDSSQLGEKPEFQHPADSHTPAIGRGRGRGVGEPLGRGGGGFKPADGDWQCPNSECGNVNFARRHQCNICHTPKPNDSKTKADPALGGPPGLFKKGDWMCIMCGNVNWERRSECNVCKAPKPGTQPVEARDGLGGGFMERQERASSTKNEVAEDGYDDFGRKKSSRARDKAAKQAAALARLQSTYGTINPDVGTPESRVTIQRQEESNMAHDGDADNERRHSRSRSGSVERSTRSGRKSSRDRSASPFSERRHREGVESGKRETARRRSRSRSKDRHRSSGNNHRHTGRSRSRDRNRR